MFCLEHCSVTDWLVRDIPTAFHSSSATQASMVASRTRRIVSNIHAPSVSSFQYMKTVVDHILLRFSTAPVSTSRQDLFAKSRFL